MELLWNSSEYWDVPLNYPIVPGYETDLPGYFNPVPKDPDVIEEPKNDVYVPLGLEFENDDAAWVMACTFLIFTMQTGHALLESGMCSQKNEVSILMSNAVAVSIAGFGFWAFGYGIVKGDHPYSTPFYGVGKYFYHPDANIHGTGEGYLMFMEHTAYATISITIPSGAMAERSNFKAMMLYSLLGILTYSFPANWIWGPKGWLKQLGAIDLAGAGAVHILGGFSALVGSWYLGPRTGFRLRRTRLVMGNAKNSIMGLFMVWWGFLAFNSGSTFGVSGVKWTYSAKATVTTMNSSFGGGTVGLLACYIFFGANIDCAYIINCVLGSLVAITGCSYLVATWEALIIGLVSGVLTFITMLVTERTKIDDACASFATHGVSGVWAMMAVGIFGRKTGDGLLKYQGLTQGGSYLLGVQLLASVVMSLWAMALTLATLWIIDKVIPLRSSLVDELLGSDYSDHNILHAGIGIENAVEVLSNYHDIKVGLDPTGNNLGHMMFLENNYADGSHPSEREYLKRARLSLHHILGGHAVTDEDIINYSKNNPRSRPIKSQGGGLLGRREYQDPELNDPLYDEISDMYKKYG